MILFSGSSNQPLSKEISRLLNVHLGDREIDHFADGEIRPWVKESVRDKTVFVIQSFSQPLSEYIMECILLADAIKRGAPKRMIGVIPYFGYARQDKQHRVGEPVSARVIAKLLEVVPFQEVITIDLHNDAIVGFFRIPVVHLSALPIIADYLKTTDLTDSVVVSPDVGGVKRARNLAFILNLPLVVMEKGRKLDKTDDSEVYQIIGDVKGKKIILIDDIISTGGTIVNGATSLREQGAQSVTVCASHGVLSGDAINKLNQAPIKKVVVSDSIHHPDLERNEKFQIVSVAPILAQTIKSIVHNE